jgi:hypothetical protein
MSAFMPIPGHLGNVGNNSFREDLMKAVAFAVALMLTAPALAQQSPPLPYKPYTVTSPDGVKLSV